MLRALCLLVLLVSIKLAAADMPVAVDVGGNVLLSRVEFFGSSAGNTSGIVKLKLTISPMGRVMTAEAISGPAVFREISLRSATQWQFKVSSTTPAVIDATVHFNPSPSEVSEHMQTGVLKVTSAPSSPPPPPSDLVVETIRVLGVSDTMRQLVLSKMSLRVGDVLTRELQNTILQQLKTVDKTLFMSFSYGSTKKLASVTIASRPVNDRDLKGRN